jgi:hypothetical protein
MDDVENFNFIENVPVEFLQEERKGVSSEPWKDHDR